MKAWVDVYNETGDALLNDAGPIFQVRRWIRRTRLNAAAEYEAHLSALDERAATYIHPLRVLRCRTIRPEPDEHSPPHFATFDTVIAHRITQRANNDGGVDLVVSGPDTLYDLSRVLVGTKQLGYTDDQPAEELMESFAPGGWTWNEDAAADPIQLQFNQETLLEALSQLAEVTGAKFSVSRQGFYLNWSSAPGGSTDGTGPTISLPVVASLTGQSVLTDSTNVSGQLRNSLLAINLEIAEESFNVYTRCKAFGAGVGINRLYLAWANAWPDGASTAAPYIDDLGITWTITDLSNFGTLRNVDAEAIYGSREVHKIWPQIIPASINTIDFQAAGNTLLKYALAYMRSVARPVKVYRCTLVSPPTLIDAGGGVDLVYTRTGDDGIVIEERVSGLLITEAVETIDESGVYTVNLTMIDAPTPPPTEASFLLEQIRYGAMSARNNQFNSQDLGTAEQPLKVVYAENIVSTGGIPLSGSEWEYAGDMDIDANSASDTLVHIRNQGAGRADLVVDRNIVLGGLINGVDIASIVGTTHDPATGGDGIDVDGAQAVSVDATVVRTSRSVATGDGLSGGGNLSANRTLAVDSSVVRNTRNIVAGAGMTGGGALSADVTLNVIGGDGITANANDVAVDATVVRTSRQVIAGAGMTGGGALSADVTLNVIAGNGIVVGANDVAVLRATPDSGLTFVSGGLALGAPGAVSALTTAAVTTTTHVHPVIAAFDVGSVAPGVETLLKATGAGALTLGSLDVTGSANILQSLYAAAQGFQVLHHTSGGAHAHVLVNPTGDPLVVDEQFGMDIYDNLRVRGYIVGNLTLQVRDMDPVIAFDGAFPLESNYTGSTLGSGGQAGRAPAACRMPIFRPGRFGKCVEIVSGGTNLFTNPSAEIGSTSYNNTGAATHTVVTTHSYFGSKSIRVQTTSGAFDGLVAIGPSHGSAQTYSAIVWVKRTEIAADLIVGLREATATQIAVTVIPKALGWQPVSVSGVTTTTGSLRVYVQKSGGAAAVVFYVDGVSMYASANCPPSAHGAMTTNEGSDAYSWTGAAHGSTTTILKTGLVYPSTSPIFTVGANGSFGCWVRLPWALSGSGGVVHYVFTAGNSNLSLRFDASGQVIFQAGGSAATAATIPLDTDWHLFFVTWSDDTNLVSLWIDGVVVLTRAYVGPTTSADMYIGCNTAGDAQLDGQIDHVMNVSRVLDAEEMLAIATADGPAFAFRSVFNLRFGRNRFSFDDEGFWGTGASGRRLIGIFAGVDGAPSTTKSWGNVNLSEGDILFGQKATSGGGWMHFDQAVTALGETPRMAWGYDDVEVLQLDVGGATLNGVLDIATSGGIFQGTGTFASPTTGLKLFNSGGVGKLSSYNATVEQVTLDTDGVLKAGGGEVKLDANGISIVRSSASAAQNNVEWKEGTTTRSGVAGYSQSGAENTLELFAVDPARWNMIWLRTDSAGSDYSRTRIDAYGTGDIATLLVQAHGAITEIELTADAVRVFGALDVSGALHATGAADFDGTLNVVGALSAASLAVGSVVLTGNLTVPNAMRINVETLRAIDATGIVFQDDAGATAMTVLDGATVEIATGKYLASEKLRARSSAGLRLEDDGGILGLFVADLGAVAVGHAAPESNTILHGKTVGSGGFAPFLFESTFAANVGSPRATLRIRSTTGGDMATGFGPTADFEINDSALAGANVIARISGLRDGGDTSGKLVFTTVAAGVHGDVLTLRADNTIVLGGPVNSQVAGTVSLIVDSPASPTSDIFRVLRATVERFTITKEGWGKFVSTAASGGGVDDVGARLILQSVKGSAGAAFDMAGQLRFTAKNSSSVDKVFVDVNGQVDVATAGSERGGLYINTQHGGADAIPFAAVGANVRMLSSGLTAADFKTGKGVLWLAPVATAPASAPTNGIFLWFDNSTSPPHLKYWQEGGSITNMT